MSEKMSLEDKVVKLTDTKKELDNLLNKKSKGRNSKKIINFKQGDFQKKMYLIQKINLNINQTKERIEVMGKTADLMSDLKNKKGLLIEKIEIKNEGKVCDGSSNQRQARVNIEEKKVEIIENIGFLKNL